MSHSLFDTLTGVNLEPSGGLTVQQLLESPGFIQGTVTVSTPLTNNTITEGLQDDEDDLFQCGRCKKQFSSLDLFMAHKRECSSKTQGMRTLEVTAAVDQATECHSAFDNDSSAITNQIHVQVHPSTGQVVAGGYGHTGIPSPGSMGQHIIVNEAELLPFTIETTQVLPISSSFLPSTSPSKSLAQGVSPLLTTTGNMNTPSLDVGAGGMSPSLPLSTIVGVQQGGTDIEAGESPVCPGGQIIEGEVGEKNDVACYNHEFFHGGMAKTSPSKVEIVKTKTKHKCPYKCGKEFSKNFDLQQHIRSHTGEKPFQCIVCGRAFTQKSNVKKHMATHRVWPQGSLQDTLPKNPIKKLIMSTSIDSYQIDILEDEDMKEEIFVDDSYVCQFCGHSQGSYVELRSHMKCHVQQKVYKCIQKKCQEVFSELDGFLEHIRMHDRDLQYKCHTCSKVFDSLNAVGCHQYDHSIYPQQRKMVGPSYFRCTKCMNKYASAEALEHHLRTSSHNYPCKQCGKVFTSERLLRRHLRVHSTISHATCPTCNKEFKSEYSLKLHQLIHTGEKPYECEVCKAAFNRRDKLKRHKLIHEAKKIHCPFRTSMGCMREFARADKLRVHMISHANGRCYGRGRGRGRGRSRDSFTSNRQVSSSTVKKEPATKEFIKNRGNSNKLHVGKSEASSSELQNNKICIPSIATASSSELPSDLGHGEHPEEIFREGRPIRQAVVRRNINLIRKTQRNRNSSYISKNLNKKQNDLEDGQEKKNLSQKEESQPNHPHSYVEERQESPESSASELVIKAEQNDAQTQNVEIIYIPFSLPLSQPMQAELIRTMSTDSSLESQNEVSSHSITLESQNDSTTDFEFPKKAQDSLEDSSSHTITLDSQNNTSNSLVYSSGSTITLEDARGSTISIEETRDPTITLEDSREPTIALASSQISAMDLESTTTTVVLEDTNDTNISLENSRGSVINLECTSVSTITHKDSASPLLIDSIPLVSANYNIDSLEDKRKEFDKEFEIICNTTSSSKYNTSANPTMERQLMVVQGLVGSEGELLESGRNFVEGNRNLVHLTDQQLHTDEATMVETHLSNLNILSQPS
ncbi:unnamed protein product, partial [Meganyctiphanes norvegica]